jgi:hypothetical protein
MTSVMAIKSEVFGSCVGEINVSVEIENRDTWFCCALIYLGFILEGTVSQDWLLSVVTVPGIGRHFRCFGLD